MKFIKNNIVVSILLGLSFMIEGFSPSTQIIFKNDTNDDIDVIVYVHRYSNSFTAGASRIHAQDVYQTNRIQDNEFELIRSIEVRMYNKDRDLFRGFMDSSALAQNFHKNIPNVILYTGRDVRFNGVSNLFR